MVRNNIIAGLILFVVLAMNGTIIFRINQRYTDSLNQALLSQSQSCGEHMEMTLLQLSRDINRELQEYNSELFENPVKFREASRNLRLFYTRYRDVINKISIYDNHKNFYALY